MTSERVSADSVGNLRRRAEEKLKKKERQRDQRPDSGEPGATTGTQRLIQELQIHQIELEMQNEELRTSQGALEEALQRYADLYDFAPVGYFSFTPEALIKAVNLTGASLLGMARQPLINRRFRKFIAPSDLDLWDQYFLSVLQQEEKQSCDLTLQRLDGSSFFARLESVHIEGSSGKTEVHTVVSDVTDRRQMEKEIREAAQHWQTTFDSIHDAIALLDLEGRFLRWNRAMEIFLGRPLKEILGRQCWELVHGTSEPIEACPVKRMRESLRRETQVFSLGDRWIEVTADPILEEKGRLVGAVHIIVDITDRHRAEAKLLTSQSQLFNALEMAQLGHWEYDLVNDLFTFNDQFYKIFRTTVEQVGGYTMPSAEYARRFVHPDDRFMVGEEIRKTIETTDLHFNRQFKHRMLYADGTVGNLSVRFFIVKDSHGRTVKSYGVNQDITEHKRAEEKIKTSLKEKEVLLQEIHHRVKNNLQIIQSLLNLQARKITDSQIREIFKESRDRIRAMALVHEKLYQSPDLSHIDLADYLQNLSIRLFQSSQVSPDRVKLKLEMREVPIGIDKAVPLGLILNELVSNALKHAFPEEREGEIRVGVARFDEGRIRLTVGDNGIGFPEGLDIRETHSMGFQVVTALVEQLEGTIELYREAGTEFRITFPEG